MKTETVEEFLARGGKIQKDEKTLNLDELLYNEGLLDKSEAEEVKKTLNNSFNTLLNDNLSKKKN